MSDFAPERRRSDRRRVRIRAEARRLDNSILAQRCPKLNLTLSNLSEGGLQAVTRHPVEVGERLAIVLPPDAGLGTSRILGRVIRCDPLRSGWQLAMKFDFVSAA